MFILAEEKFFDQNRKVLADEIEWDIIENIVTFVIL